MLPPFQRLIDEKPDIKVIERIRIAVDSLTATLVYQHRMEVLPLFGGSEYGI